MAFEKQTDGLSAAQTIAGLVARQAAVRPDATAIFAPGRPPLAYRDLLWQIHHTARALRRFGINRKDRVALVLPNGPEAATAFLAVSSAATCAPLNPAYRAEEFDYYLSDLNAVALIVGRGTHSPAVAVARSRGIAVLKLSSRETAGTFDLDAPAVVEEAPGDPEKVPVGIDLAGPQDVALVLHTSGTTSRPKIVPLTHAQRDPVRRQHRLRPGLVPAGPLPECDAAVSYPRLDGGNPGDVRGGCVRGLRAGL